MRSGLLCGQVIADAKYTPCLLNAPDWGNWNALCPPYGQLDAESIIRAQVMVRRSFCTGPTTCSIDAWSSVGCNASGPEETLACAPAKFALFARRPTMNRGLPPTRTPAQAPLARPSADRALSGTAMFVRQENTRIGLSRHRRQSHSRTLLVAQFPDCHAAERESVLLPRRSEALNRFPPRFLELRSRGPGRPERLKDDILGILKPAAPKTLADERLDFRSRDLDLLEKYLSLVPPLTYDASACRSQRLLRRQDSSWTREGHAQRSSSSGCVAERPCDRLVVATRRRTSPLQLTA